MSVRARVLFLALWIASLVAVGAVVTAQSRSSQSDQILSGPDLGFRVQPGTNDGKTVKGTFVVRMNGQWVEAHMAGGAFPITTR